MVFSRKNKSTYKNDSTLTEKEQNYNKDNGGGSPYVLEDKYSKISKVFGINP